MAERSGLTSPIIRAQSLLLAHLSHRMVETFGKFGVAGPAAVEVPVITGEERVHRYMGSPSPMQW